MFDHLFWSKHFETVFVKRLGFLIEILKVRILPSFSNIGTEADELVEKTYEKLLNASVESDSDSETIYDTTFQTGLNYYSSVSEIQQSILNVYSMFLYHAWEQQVLTFHRKQLLHPADENKGDLIDARKAFSIMKDQGIDVKAFECWPKIYELKKLCNSVKHSDGRACNELKSLNKELFHHPECKSNRTNIIPQVLAPLLGKDIYVTVQDLEDYCEALKKFWNELAYQMSIHH